MAWMIGIDEAGYGPNLGPLVMSAVALRVPESLLGRNLWQALRRGVRRHDDEADERLLIADSKLCYSPQRGLADLEIGVLATLAAGLSASGFRLCDYLDAVGPDSHAAIRAESWYLGETLLPCVIDAGVLADAVARFRDAARRVDDVRARSVVVCAEEFNRLLDLWGSKGAILTHGLSRLCRFVLALEGDEEPIHIHVDKHGGRNNYCAILQEAMAEGMVVARSESAARSVYEVLGLPRRIRFIFEPRADAEHLTVALASMASKYLRELLMKEFNGFWAAKLPDLKPTAGYPLDAARFYRLIRPVVQELGLAEDKVWRRK